MVGIELRPRAPLFVDHFLHTAMFYPGGYGFIPRRHPGADDGGAMDIMVVCQTPRGARRDHPRAPDRHPDERDEAGGDEKVLAGHGGRPSPVLCRCGGQLALAARHPDRADRPLFQHYQGPGKGKSVEDHRLGRARAEPADLIRAAIRALQGRRLGPDEIQEYRGAVAQALFLVARGDVIGGGRSASPQGVLSHPAERRGSAGTLQSSVHVVGPVACEAQPAARLQQPGEPGHGLGLDDAALVVPRLGGPGIGKRTKTRSRQPSGRLAISSRASPSSTRTIWSAAPRRCDAARWRPVLERARSR